MIKTDRKLYLRMTETYIWEVWSFGWSLEHVCVALPPVKCFTCHNFKHTQMHRHSQWSICGLNDDQLN